MLRTALLLMLLTPFIADTRNHFEEIEIQIDTGERFALAFFQVVGAEQSECSPLVVSQVRSRSLRVICATFEDGFEQLEKRSRQPWPERIVAVDLAPPALRFAPETEWESTGLVHQRLYRVGENVVGVRFVPGEVLVVW